MSDNFVLDVTRIREKVQERMDQGPSTRSYGPDVAQVVAILNDVVATGVVCWTRYTRDAICASGGDRAQVAAEFREHAAQEMRHALWAAERVSQLGGAPDPDPMTVAAYAHIDHTTSWPSGSSSKPTGRSCSGWATETRPPAGSWSRSSRKRKSTLTTFSTCSGTENNLDEQSRRRQSSRSGGREGVSETCTRASRNNAVSMGRPRRTAAVRPRPAWIGEHK